ncbi:MAG: glycoside hydrolase family 68 protein [Alphaproteobacteria bacterium]|nr:glycoside hydrolase family 68 protein [Alphaproteobacteria bacterium]
MVLKLDNQWIWDSWYARKGDLWHAFFLKADKSLGDPDLRHFNVSQGHATSTDLTNWSYLGTTISPSDGPAFDDMTVWTGSVIAGQDGLWHLFYTGGSRAENALIQRIGHAVSEDLHHWRRTGRDGLCLDMKGPAARHYETAHMIGHWHDRAMRDPFVIADPEGEGYLMFFTARAEGVAEANAGGAIGLATSPDLDTWTLEPPVFVGGFGQLEVPQVFETGGRWYCLFCTSAQHWSEAYRAANRQPPVTGSHYLMADNPRGPWRIAPGPFFDGALPSHRYAARILDTDKGLRILGFADGGKTDFGGYIFDPEPVSVDAEGLLRIVTNGKAAD